MTIDSKEASSFLRTAAEKLGVPPLSLTQASRGQKHIAFARAVAYLAARSIWPDACWAELGRVFFRDRKSVRLGVRRARDISGAQLLAKSIQNAHLKAS